MIFTMRRTLAIEGGSSSVKFESKNSFSICFSKPGFDSRRVFTLFIFLFGFLWNTIILASNPGWVLIHVQDNRFIRKKDFFKQTETKSPLTPGRVYMFLLDVFLFVGLILLLSPFSTGLSGHEFIGAIFFLFLILHLLFSWSWIKGSTRRFLVQSGWRERFNYILNLTLFVFVVLEIVSGLIVSQILVPSIGIKTISDDAWRGLHQQSSVAIVILISLHISLNWQRMVSYFRKRISPPNSKNEMRHVFFDFKNSGDQGIAGHLCNTYHFIFGISGSWGPRDD